MMKKLFLLSFLPMFFFYCGMNDSAGQRKEYSSDSSLYVARIQKIKEELKVPDSYGQNPFMPIQDEAKRLEVFQVDKGGRKHELTPETVEAWKKMVEAAKQDGVILLSASAFRSVNRQKEIIKGKLAKGQKIENILTVNTAPGYSEHHTGRALDITTPGVEPITQEFENTKAFKWLVKNASKFQFELSYPKNNPYNIIYEPWHWRYNPHLKK